MNFEKFQLERQQSTWENKVDYNLSESGVHPGTFNTLFEPEFIAVSYKHLTLPTNREV